MTRSLVDLMVEVERPTSVAEVNDLFASRATSHELEGILGGVIDEDELAAA